MYKIKTSELLSGKRLVEDLININIVRVISDELLETKHHYLMVAYSLRYKIEFSFDKVNSICQYIMVEENVIRREWQNTNIEFIDDIYIFGKPIDIVKDIFRTKTSQNDFVRIGNVELYFEDNKVDSLYYFPNKTYHHESPI